MNDEIPFRSGYVALVGLPNAGKSTLMNQLVHQKLAIVSPKPQTTRRRTLGIVSGPGYQMILLDSPGILEPHYALQKAMMKTVWEVLGDADVACCLIDVSSLKPGAVEIPDALRNFKGTRIAAVNKVDLVRGKATMIPLLKEIYDTGLFAEVVPISALTGEGVEELVRVLVKELPLGSPFYPEDQLTEQPERFFVGEIVREQVFLHYSEEVPYAVEVEVEEFKERPGAKDYIEIHLYVEQASQKAILIGRGGQAIRSVGEHARLAIEEFLGRPVFLQLQVKVAAKWRRNEAALRRFGYRT
jgi:GTP-binding protein Era